MNRPHPCPLALGQAIAHIVHLGSSRNAPIELVFGTVAQVNPAARRVTMIDAEGRRRTVGTMNIGHRGYCAACDAPAHLSGEQLVCPMCGSPAPLPPPDEWQRAAWGPYHNLTPCIIARLLAGCPTWRAAWELATSARTATRTAPGLDAERAELLAELKGECPHTFNALLMLYRVYKHEGVEQSRDVCEHWLRHLDDLAAELPGLPLEPADDRTPDRATTPPPAFLRRLLGDAA